MSAINKFRPFVSVIPEDEANRQLVNGFILHDAVADRVVQVRAPAGGWGRRWMFLKVSTCRRCALTVTLMS